MSAWMVPGKFARSLLAMTVSLAAIAPAAAEVDSPSGQELVQQFVDVCGGREAYAKIRNRVITAKVDLPDHGMEGELVEIFTPPDYRRVVVVDVYDPVVAGLTAGNAWHWDEFGEVAEMDEALAADTLRHGQLNPFLDWTPDSGEAKVVGESVIEGDACHRVEIVPADGSPLLAFFSVETGLLRRIDDRNANTYRYFDDYRKQDGVLIPHKVRVDFGMMMLHLEFTSIRQNVELGEFIADELPETVQTERIEEMLDMVANGDSQK